MVPLSPFNDIYSMLEADMASEVQPSKLEVAVSDLFSEGENYSNFQYLELNLAMNKSTSVFRSLESFDYSNIDAQVSGGYEFELNTKDGLPLNSIVPLPTTSSSVENKEVFENKKKTQKRIRMECQCPNCSSDSANKIRRSDGKLLHSCHYPDCKKTFGYVHTLKRHLDTHAGRKGFACKQCEKEFARKDKLNEHVRLKHSNVRQKYTCDFLDCGKVFSLQANLRRHKEGHSGKKNFGCTYCGDRFSRKEHLTKHLRKHGNNQSSLGPTQLRNNELPEISSENVSGATTVSQTAYSEHLPIPGSSSTIEISFLVPKPATVSSSKFGENNALDTFETQTCPQDDLPLVLSKDALKDALSDFLIFKVHTSEVQRSIQ